MYQKKKIILSRKNRKTESISYRCSLETKQKMENKAKKLGISVGRYIDDCIETNLKRNPKTNKQKVKIMVEGQEAMNQMILGLAPEQQEIKDSLINITKGKMRLWDF